MNEVDIISSPHPKARDSLSPLAHLFSSASNNLLKETSHHNFVSSSVGQSLPIRILGRGETLAGRTMATLICHAVQGRV